MPHFLLSLGLINAHVYDRFYSGSLSLEQHKLQLKLAMEERMKDITAHKEMVTAQARVIEENASTLNRGR